MDEDKIEKILKDTKTIAIVGLSPNPLKDSHRVGKYLQSVGFKIIPVYPKEDEILGCKVRRSLQDIDEKIDMVVMFRKGSFAKPLYEEIRKKDIKHMWLQLGIENNEVYQMAKSDGVGFVQNKCIMIEHKRLKEI